jgi:hypothetical protein
VVKGVESGTNVKKNESRYFTAVDRADKIVMNGQATQQFPQNRKAGMQTV